MKHELVLVIDFGGQYNQLIARRVRENNVYCEILPYNTDIEVIKAKNPKGIIAKKEVKTMANCSACHKKLIMVCLAKKRLKYLLMVLGETSEVFRNSRI